MKHTLVHHLAHLAQKHPDALYVRFLKAGLLDDSLTYGEAWWLSCSWADLLRAHGVGAGERVLLALPNTRDFVGGYFGALILGAVPVPMAPLKAETVHLAVERAHFVDARAVIVPNELLSGELCDALDGRAVLTSSAVDEVVFDIAPQANEADIALLQFTSGTSGSAKGVMLSHRALLAQCEGLSRVLRLLDPAEDWAVSWLPLFHDMGLIGFLLTPMLRGGHVTLLRTEEFASRPALWIRALSDYRASITGAPPSAYALCARFVKDADLVGFDLSRVRIALVGAETITPTSLHVFTERFAPFGFRETSLLPTYGLAENSLAVTMPPLDRGPRFDTVDREALAEGTAMPASHGETRAFASVGLPLPQTELAVVGENGTRLSERCIGEIIVRSPSLMEGYDQRHDASAEALRDGWLYTGDLGYLADGELYITGRTKEVLIVGGRNYYPDDLEHVAGEVNGVRMRRAVAFSVHDAARETEAVIIAVETGLTAAEARNDLRVRVRQAVSRAGYPVHEVVLLPPKTIALTANGKVRRVECKERYLAGALSDGA